MQQKAMGDSGLFCSALGFGTWELSTTQYGAIDVAQASEAVAMAIDYGITLFDTAEVYGPYHSEELLGKALGKRRHEIVLVTKVGFTYEADPLNGGYKISGRNSKHDYIIERTEGCLQRLNTDSIDLMLIHWPDHDTPFEESIRALEELKAAGKIRHYGVSNFTVAMMEQCETVGHLAANQVGYHLFDRRMETEVLPYCLAHQIGFMAYGSLAFGLLTGAFTPQTEFVDWDWRSKGSAFGLPLFEREHFLKELRVTAAAPGLCRRSWAHGGAVGACLGHGAPRRFGGAGGDAQRAGVGRKCKSRRVEVERGGSGRNRPHFC